MDKDFFETFYRKNFKKMINRLQKMGVPFDDAQDIAQNIMLEIYTRYDENYIKEHKFWTLVRLRAIDYHRAMQRKQNREGEEDG